MVLCLFGESCTGKSTIADAMKKRFSSTNGNSQAMTVTVYTGNDYIRFAKNEPEAKQRFTELLQSHVTDSEYIVYVVSDKEQLAFLPEGTIRVLVSADLDTIKERFAKRTGGVLPPPLAAFLERRHGSFDNEPHVLEVISGQDDLDSCCETISKLMMC